MEHWRLTGLSIPSLLFRRDVPCFRAREAIVRKSESGHFIRVVFGKELFHVMQSPIEAHTHIIGLPLDQGWSFLSVLSYAAFGPRFFYRSISIISLFAFIVNLNDWMRNNDSYRKAQ
jgi:hypothetical protein